MRSGARVIVSGLIGQYPIGGVTWDYIQYVVGLMKLGHDVYYIEDSDQWPYDPVERGSAGRDGIYNAAYLSSVMRRFGLADRWAYRFPGGALPDGTTFPEAWYGLGDQRRRAVIQSADLLLDVSSGVGDPTRYREVGRLAYVDTDPVFTQIRALQEPEFRRHLDAHDVLFSYGERLSDAAAPGAAVLGTGHTWLPMRKPIALSEWRPEAPRREVFTTVMNWTSYHDVRHLDQSYGQKDTEFERFLDLPARVAPTVLEVALGGGLTRRAPVGLLAEAGWRLVDPMCVCPDLDGYRSYIESSKAEWTVAKHGYVLGQVGWFSGRSACYLAAGRPVVVQDTGFDCILPVGEGILSFRTIEEAAAAIAEVNGAYARHAAAARAIAEQYFGATKVLAGLVEASLSAHV